MRVNDKQWSSKRADDIFGLNYHRFMEMEGASNHMEIAEELGISLGEVKALKKKVNRT